MEMGRHRGQRDNERDHLQLRNGHMQEGQAQLLLVFSKGTEKGGRFTLIAGKENAMKNLEVQDTVGMCIHKLEFIEHFFSFVPLRETDIPKHVTDGLCLILRDVIDDLERAVNDEGPEEQVSEAGKENDYVLNPHV